MKTVWLVEAGEYSDRYVVAVCSSYEQAAGVAVQSGYAYVGGEVEMWEPEDGTPPYKSIYTVIVRPGRDSTHSVDVSMSTEPIAVDAPMPTPAVVTSPSGRNWPWARAEGYSTEEEAERAARAAFEAIS